MPERTRIRSRYETEYKANFRTPDLQKVYSPPKLRPRGFEELLQRDGVPKQHGNLHGYEQATGETDDKRHRGNDTPHMEHETLGNNPEHPRPSEDQQQGHDRPPSDRGLRYRAGQAFQMPRPIRQNFVSEYQRQFTWKNLQNHESPMLSADKMVHASQAEVPAPTKNIKMPLKTEYQVQFTEFPTFEHRRTDRQAAIGETKQRPVKTKPVKEITKRSSDDEPFMKYPAHNSPVVHSEYLSNFQPPSKYRYVKGAWLGAAPPHLMPSGDTLAGKGDVSMVKDNAWYQQVLELRQRACSYKNRARGDSEFLKVLRKLGDEQSQILKRAQENSAPPSNCAMEIKTPPLHHQEKPLGKKRASHSAELVSDRRHSEDLGSNRRQSKDVDDVVSITQSDNQSNHSF